MSNSHLASAISKRLGQAYLLQVLGSKAKQNTSMHH